MALIKCPECKKEVSSAASTCPHCGYPIMQVCSESQKDIEFEQEVHRLTEKIEPDGFICPEPRVKVCIKCGTPFQNFGNINAKKQNTPGCNCQLNGKHFPGVEIDYPLMQTNGAGTELYILEEVQERNIGDIDSDEYKNHIAHVRAFIQTQEENEKRAGKENWKCDAIPPNPKMFGVQPSSAPMRQPISVQNRKKPKCPYCDSYDLEKITTAKKALKFSVIGLFEVGEFGKTWKCKNCGSKF